MRAPVHPDNHWRKREATSTIEDEVFIAMCLQLWDKGRDTKDISVELLVPENVVESVTRRGRERRRKDREA